MNGDTRGSIQRIRLWRKRRKMTLEELSQKLGTSAGHLHKWETDKVAINVDRLNAIAAALEVGIHDLIADPSRFDAIPVLGVLDPLGHIEFVEDFATGEPLNFVDAPDGVDVDAGAAIEVAADALQPVPNGWLLFFNRSYGGVPDSAVGNLCVIKRANEPEWIVRRLGLGSKPPLFSLFSSRTTEILDVKLEWAAPVICLTPAPRMEPTE